MRIGVFLKGHPPHSGGGYTFEVEVLNALLEDAKSTQHCFVIFGDPNWELSLRQRAVPANVEFDRLRMGISWRWRSILQEAFPLLNLLGAFPGQLSRAAKKARIDVMWFLPGGGYEVLDLPYIATVWDLMHRSHPWFPELAARGAWYVRELRNRRFLQQATRIIVGTEAGVNEVNLYYQVPRNRIRKIPHPTPVFASTAREMDLEQTWEEPESIGPYLIYPAQFWPHKNHVVILHALKHLNAVHNRPVSVVMVGSDQGNMEHVKSLAARLGISSQVQFTGFVSRNHLIALYSRSLALVYPSHCGPENLPPLEAFALACPVIAADIDGAREQLGDAAMLFDPNDHAALASRILEVLDNKVIRENLVERGLARAASWTPGDYIRGVFKIIDEIVTLRRTWAGSL